jgi:hypothetical protein
LIVTSLLLLGVAVTLVTKAMSSLKKITHEPKIETTQ